MTQMTVTVANEFPHRVQGLDYTMTALAINAATPAGPAREMTAEQAMEFAAAGIELVGVDDLRRLGEEARALNLAVAAAADATEASRHKQKVRELWGSQRRLQVAYDAAWNIYFVPSAVSYPGGCEGEARC